MTNLIIDYSHQNAAITKDQLEKLGYKTFIVSTKNGEKITAINVKEDIITKINSSNIEQTTIKSKQPYVLASREIKDTETIIELDYGIKIGKPYFVAMAGPCSVESEEQIMNIAEKIKESGCHILRGGSFKPRSSPYAFQGLGKEGLKILKKAGELYRMPIVTEVMDSDDIEAIEEYSDIIQVGARNCQNYSLLKKLGKSKRPVLLKRGMMTTIKEFLLSAEYILSGGNMQVILCERGIRTFETETRNTLDLASVPLLKEKSHLPVIVDPSHGTGVATLVKPMALASLASGADGVMIEVHNDPKNALSDGEQSITPEEFKLIMDKIIKLAEHFDKKPS